MKGYDMTVFAGPLIIFLLITFVLLLASRKTRTVAAILFGSLLVLLFLGFFSYRVSGTPRTIRMNQFNIPQPTVQNFQTDDADNTARIPDVSSNNKVFPVQQIPPPPGYPTENQIAGQPATEWHEDSQLSYSSLVAAVSSSSPTWFAFGFLAILGLLFLGGLAFIIAMLTIPKTRPLGIVLLVAGSILILPIVAGLFWLAPGVPAPAAPNIGFQPARIARNIQPPKFNIQPQKPIMPLSPIIDMQAPDLKFSQSTPDAPNLIPSKSYKLTSRR